MPEKKGRILSGFRPTGKCHVGNLVGVLQNWISLQDDYECFFEIADWHMLTTGYAETGELREMIREMAIDWVASGLDPKKSPFLVQSRVKEHAELHLLFSMLTPTPWLIRNPSVKEQARALGLIENEDEVTKINYGHLGYPVLQAADILIYKADTVPVGEDQVPHIELCREIARRFNGLYGNVFPEPQSKLTRFPRVPGLDGQRMSKSSGNTILISDPPEVIRSKVATMFTDSLRPRRSDPGHPDNCPVFAYHRMFNDAETGTIRRDCESARLGCVDCKARMAEKLAEALAPIRERRGDLERDPGLIEGILEEGTDRARVVARKTMEEVRGAMKLW
jgi:tryptophanyl-tRNA synthetase